MRLGVVDIGGGPRGAYATGILGGGVLTRIWTVCMGLRPRPPGTCAALPRELSVIGNNVNQIAHAANSKKDIISSEIDEAAKLVREDIDIALSRAYTMDTFWHELKQTGYKTKQGPTIKHTAVRPSWPGVIFAWTAYSNPQK